MKERIPEMEYVFCDTGEELQETYEYLFKIEAHLDREIVRLNPDRPFKHYLELYRGVLPDPRTRWCTRMLKIRPFERYVGEDPVRLYVGIRADESHRKGYISTKRNITSCFPFVDEGIRREDVMDILQNSGLGLPDYYRWRSRSGCYFCFFQQRREWVGLLENHKGLFWQAADFEKTDPKTGTHFTWNERESLKELADPKRVADIKTEYVERRARAGTSLLRDGTLSEVFEGDQDHDSACLICHL